MIIWICYFTYYIIWIIYRYYTGSSDSSDYYSIIVILSVIFLKSFMKISPGSAALGDFGGLRVATFASSGAASGRATTATTAAALVLSCATNYMSHIPYVWITHIIVRYVYDMIFIDSGKWVIQFQTILYMCYYCYIIHIS